MSPYGIRPRNLRIDGVQAKGYVQDDLINTVRRYVPKAEARALVDELRSDPEGPVQPNPPSNGEPSSSSSS